MACGGLWSHFVTPPVSHNSWHSHLRHCFACIYFTIIRPRMGIIRASHPISRQDGEEQEPPEAPDSVTKPRNELRNQRGVLITHDVLWALLHYDGDTGLFTHKTRDLRWFKHCKDPSRACTIWNSQHAGRPAFCQAKGNCLVGKVLGVCIAAHRLAWCMATGAWPVNVIDHENHVATDNRLLNLRDVTQAINTRNLPLYSTNTSGVAGVQLLKSGNWKARIGGRSLGTFSTKECASEVRKQAQDLLRFHPMHGTPAPQHQTLENTS
jgi:hypothetical protein